jgi:hypothetical protein
MILTYPYGDFQFTPVNLARYLIKFVLKPLLNLVEKMDLR